MDAVQSHALAHEIRADSVTLSEKFDSVKKANILCTGGGDDVQRILKEKLDGPHMVLESGHWPMITKPAELAQAMLELTCQSQNHVPIDD
jgi:hypothetical protein